MKKAANTFKLMIFTAILGAFAGLVIWCFLKAVSISTGLIWEKLPKSTGFTYAPLIICILGGLIVGIIHRFSGDYPEELQDVMEKIQKDKHYDYHPMAAMLLCAFFPLVCGASVGPEAGLTGIIAALCYWVGDNVTFAKNNTEMISEIGEAVTLGQLFHSPLFGILAVEENDDETTDDTLKQMSRGSKLMFYGISTASGFLVVNTMNGLFGVAMSGFPSFSAVSMEKNDFISALIYIPAGLILYALFELNERLMSALSRFIPPVIRETLCGAVIGLIAISIPLAMFSGEEQMGEMILSFTEYSPLFLAGICLLKIIMTIFCIRLGMKGGHFFPLIFSCTLLGLSLSLLIFAGDPAPHAAFAAATVTATVLGAQLKKPIAASLLLLLCFPINTLFWIFLCAAIGRKVSERFKTT